MQKDITKTYKYRLYPNKNQIEMFESAGTVDNTRGEDVRPQSRKRIKANLNETRSSLP